MMSRRTSWSGIPTAVTHNGRLPSPLRKEALRGTAQWSPNKNSKAPLPQAASSIRRAHGRRGPDQPLLFHVVAGLGGVSFASAAHAEQLPHHTNSIMFCVQVKVPVSVASVQVLLQDTETSSGAPWSLRPDNIILNAPGPRGVLQCIHCFVGVGARRRDVHEH